MSGRAELLAAATREDAAGNREAADRLYAQAGADPIPVVLRPGCDTYRFARSSEGIPHLRPGGAAGGGEPGWIVMDAVGRASFRDEADAREWASVAGKKA